MAKKTTEKESGGKGLAGIGGFLNGLGSLVGKLGDLAETGQELRKTGEIHGPEGKLKGVYGFSIRSGIGGDRDIKIEPFGNVSEDEDTGKPVVHEVREPMVDVFDEDDHIMVVAEMPGVGKDDVSVVLKDDILTITAERGDMKYRKELLLPRTLSPDGMGYKCRNGVVEVTIKA
ncbi:MAG: Hsp20/alpha crystallin family protein [Lentisphaerae bacterium]|nr:Hsp20/alpha crystallin family protein [Lentisphaerota bacterium]